MRGVSTVQSRQSQEKRGAVFAPGMLLQRNETSGNDTDMRVRLQPRANYTVIEGSPKRL